MKGGERAISGAATRGAKVAESGREGEFRWGRGGVGIRFGGGGGVAELVRKAVVFAVLHEIEFFGDVGVGTVAGGK